MHFVEGRKVTRIDRPFFNVHGYGLTICKLFQLFSAAEKGRGSILPRN